MSAYGIWNEIAAAKPETIFRNVTLEEFRDFHWTAKDEFVGEAIEEVFTEWTHKPGVAWVGAIGCVSDAMAPWNAIGVIAVTFTGTTVEDVKSGNGHFEGGLCGCDNALQRSGGRLCKSHDLFFGKEGFLFCRYL